MAGTTTPVDRTATALAAGLAFTSGAIDVLCFTRLGQAFASVITGNLVSAGAAIGRQEYAATLHAAVAVLAYAIGVSAGSSLLRSPGDGEPWPRRVGVVLGIELGLMIIFSVGWIVTGPQPAGPAQVGLLALAGSAMGLQSSGFRLVGLKGVSTTYLTGTLTGLLAGLVIDRKLNAPAGIALLAVLAGAVVSGLLVALDARWATLLPLSVLAVVMVFVGTTRRR